MEETQNDAPFVAFYDMHAVTFVPTDEMADVTIAGLQVKIQSIDFEDFLKKRYSNTCTWLSLYKSIKIE